MPTAKHDRLEDQQYVVLLVRLLVDPSREIVHGDVGGPETHDAKLERWIHFHGANGLLGAVQAWLATATSPMAPSELADP